MSFGKMTEFIEIIDPQPTTDAAGFKVPGDQVLASVRAYQEVRRGNAKWANLAAFSTATCLFRFRAIPGLEVTTTMAIQHGDKRYRITQAEDVRGKGRYWECWCELSERLVPNG